MGLSGVSSGLAVGSVRGMGAPPQCTPCPTTSCGLASAQGRDMASGFHGTVAE